MKTIILTGPKHSGKTSVGKALASLCSCDFVDLDESITQRTGKNPRQLFIEGQEIFQKAEVEAAASLFNADGTSKDDTGENNAGADDTNVAGDKWRVIATGGGIIDNAQAVAALKKVNAMTVYLNISTETAWNRISAGGELPPFLRTENPRKTHRVLHERRAKAYLQFADFAIKADSKTPQEIAEEILIHFS